MTRPTTPTTSATAESGSPAASDDSVTANAPATTAAAEIESWVRLAVEGAEDRLGLRTEAFLVGEVLGITDWFVITSGQTGRQVRAIVEGVEEMVFLGDGPRPLRIEGKDAPDWVLMDYGSFIVHVFTEEAREFYDLERLWSDMPRLELERLDGSMAEVEAEGVEAEEADTADGSSS